MQAKWLYLFPLALTGLAAGIWLAQVQHAPELRPASVPAALWRVGFADLDGKQQELAQWRGQGLVLNFWASWCQPCREEMPDFAALRAHYRPYGIEFVGIAVDSPARVVQFLQQLPVDYPILIGEGAAHSLARQLGNPSGALPYTIVVDREGNIVLTHLGRLRRAVLEPALRKIGA